MEQDVFNFVEIQENAGKGKIIIDKTKIKGLSSYEIKRGTGLIELTIRMSVPPENLKTIC